MPLYEFSCECGSTTDEFRTVALRNEPKFCTCGKPMERVITGYKTIGDLEPHYDENLESWVKSKQHRRQIMKEKGVHEAYGKGWR